MIPIMRESSENTDANKLTSKQNIIIMRKLVKDWGLGPIKAYDNSQGNPKFWLTIAKKHYITVAEARRMNCANCEYGSISTEALKSMEHIPYNKYDKDGGMRVWCDKFDFICHATRVCQAWDSKSESGED